MIKIRALLFDVFGTCVDWRKSVTDALYNAAQASGESRMVRPLSPALSHLNP
jgi:hypothetical protein